MKLEQTQPATPTIAKGTKQQFVANGLFDATSVQDLSDAVTWATATPAVAVVSNDAASNGLATGLTVGTREIAKSDWVYFVPKRCFFEPSTVLVLDVDL